MTWKFKGKGDKYIAEVVSDDLSHAISKQMNGGAKGR
jgi:hypothetical protein